MAAHQQSAPWRVCLLGALNGLIYGVVADRLYLAYSEYEVRRYVEEADASGHLPGTYASLHNPLTLPFIFVILFAAAAYFLARRGRRTARGAFLFWETVGLLAVTAFVLVWYVNRPWQPVTELAAVWVASLLLAAPICFIYGRLIRAAFKLKGPGGGSAR